MSHRPPLPLLSNLEKISSNFSCTPQTSTLTDVAAALDHMSPFIGCNGVVPKPSNLIQSSSVHRVRSSTTVHLPELVPAKH